MKRKLFQSRFLKGEGETIAKWVVEFYVFPRKVALTTRQSERSATRPAPQTHTSTTFTPAGPCGNPSNSENGGNACTREERLGCFRKVSPPSQ